MGMSASQARYLMLTSRKSDLELQAQIINQRIIRLSQETVRFTEEYTAAISNKKIEVADNSGTETQWKELANNFDKLLNSGYKIHWGKSVLTKDDIDEYGRVKSGTTTNEDGEEVDTYFTNAQIQQMFESYAWTLHDAKGDEVQYGADYGSTVREVMDESDDAQAEAEYQSNVTKIQAQEKILELQLKNIETEHKAIDTEIDTVKKYLQKNIERSFKTFAG